MSKRDCLGVVLMIVGICAIISGVACLGVSLIQLLFGTGRNIAMAYAGLILWLSGHYVGKFGRSMLED